MSVPNTNRWILIADGISPTTILVEALLAGADSTQSVETYVVGALSKVRLAGSRLMFSRVCDPMLHWLPKRLVSSNVEYAYYLDDNFWEIPEDSVHASWYKRADVIESLNNFVANAKIVLTSSSELASKVLRMIPSANVCVLPAPFDFELLADLGEQFPSRSDVVKIGFAGSERGSAFDTVALAINRIIDDFGTRVSFEFIGHIPSSLKVDSRIQFIERVDTYSEFIALKRSRKWDIGLAPLTDNPFYRCKTNNKFREYGALGIAGIYSNVPPYCQSVTNGITGWLVDNTVDEWEDVLRRAITDPLLRKAIAANSNAIVRSNYSMPVVRAKWESIILENVAQVPFDISLRLASIHLRLALSNCSNRFHAYGRELSTEGLSKFLRNRLRNWFGV